MNRAVAFALLSFAFPAALRAGHRHHPFTSTTTVHDSSRVASCADFYMRCGRGKNARAEERITIPASEVHTLDAFIGPQGGILLEGSEGSNYEATLCKAVPYDDGAEETLSRIKLTRSGGKLRVDGPDTEWLG